MPVSQRQSLTDPALPELGVVEDGAERLKSGGTGFTVREGVTLNCSLPDVPVTTSE
jgi:hypothetical protein